MITHTRSMILITRSVTRQRHFFSFFYRLAFFKNLKKKKKTPASQPFSRDLVSTRASTHVTGSVQVKLGFVSAPNTPSQMDFDEVFSELVKRSRPSLVSAPPVGF